MADEPKPLVWRATSKADFAAFPSAVKREMGYALFLAQMGTRHPIMARTLKGFGSATIVEVRKSDAGNAYRAVYTVRFADAIYVLHAFQKKSNRGISTPKQELRLVEKRFRELVDERAGR